MREKALQLYIMAIMGNSKLPGIPSRTMDLATSRRDCMNIRPESGVVELGGYSSSPSTHGSNGEPGVRDGGQEATEVLMEDPLRDFGSTALRSQQPFPLIVELWLLGSTERIGGRSVDGWYSPNPWAGLA